MGCGSSNSLTVPSSTLEYKYNVNEVWRNVDKTVDGSSNNNRKIVVNRSGWKTVRIFVSSTFKDFHAEREVLVKEVFPDLRIWCQKRRLHLVDCDLRWGIPKDTTSGETLRLCLGEIDRCYQDNIMPFFLNLTSERCGWIPTFDDVPQNITNEYRWVHGLSVTEMEIMHGAYRTDNPNSLFMMRNTSFLNSLPAQYKDDFIDANPVAVHKLSLLKDRLKDRLDRRVKWYDCKFDCIDEDGKLEFTGLQDNFAKPVFEFFKSRIEEQYPLQDASTTDPNQVIRESHESFMKTRGELVLGRTSILEKIQHYVTDIGVDYPLVVLGGPGSGKSAILARTADVAATLAAQNKIPGGGDSGWHVFYHFVGAVPGSTDLEKCLKRLLVEINAVNESTMPKNLESTCQATCSALSLVKTKPVIVIVDALNQFDDDKAATILSWLPRKLAPQIRVIISMIDETPPHKALKERGYKPKDILVNPLDMNTRKVSSVIYDQDHALILLFEDKSNRPNFPYKEIVTEMLKKFNKKLDDEQMNNLLGKQTSHNPLWLAIACEELRVYGVYEKITDKINHLSDGLIELLFQVFDRFEQENGGNLLVATLCLLESSQTGLLETELLHILSDEDNLIPKKTQSGGFFKFMSDTAKSEKSKYSSSLPAAKWAVVYRALRSFLRPFGDSGEGRLDFYHRALSKAVRKKYLKEENDRKWWHRKLAEYFYESENIERKVEELPYNLIKIGDTQKLTATLTDWRVFELLYNEDYSEELMKYWREGFAEQDWQLKLRDAYEEVISKEKATMSDDVLSQRYEQVSRILQHAGQYDDAFAFLQKSMALETEKLGGRPERMVELHDLAAAIYDDKFKSMYIWVEKKHLPEYGIAIKHFRASIKIRETLSGNVHKHKLGKTLTMLSFTLMGWMERGGDNNFSSEEAQEQGNQYIQKAMDIFTELGENGMLAESTMTKSTLVPRGSDESLKFLLDAYEQCLQAYGEISVLTARILLNTGIHYEDVRDMKMAAGYFIRWNDVCEEVYGYHHPKTKRARDTLARPHYTRLVAEYRQKQHLQQQMAEELGSNQW